jgi:hypothetical protein
MSAQLLLDEATLLLLLLLLPQAPSAVGASGTWAVSGTTCLTWRWTAASS